MHELGLMQDMLTVAFDQAAMQGMTRIERVMIRVGSLSGIEPECLSLAFEALCAATIAEGAQLELERPVAAATCLHCGQRFEPQLLGDSCPSCNGLAVDLQQGMEFELVWMEGVCERV